MSCEKVAKYTIIHSKNFPFLIVLDPLTISFLTSKYLTIGQIRKISPFLKISYLVLNEEERKKERKANRIITLEGENDEKVEL